MNLKHEKLEIKNGELVKYFLDEEELIIPNGVTRIGYNAEYGKDNLNRVYITEGVTKIDM